MSGIETIGKISRGSSNVVANVAALQALNGASITDGALYVTRDHSTEGDGGGGDYRYDSSSSITAITNMVIVPADGIGRFLRNYGPVLDARADFMAKGDYVTDDTAALQAAIDFAQQPTYGPYKYSTTFAQEAALSVYIPPGTYKTTDTLVFYSAEIYGKIGSTSNRWTSTVIWAFHGNHVIKFSATDATNYNVGSLHDFLVLGSPESYQPNKKSIVSVASRVSFNVAVGDVPATASLGTQFYAFFYDNEDTYLGCGLVSAVNSGTGEITLSTGFDSYATVTGSGSLLTTSDKVVFTPLVTENVYSNVADPAAAGQCGIFVENIRTTGISTIPRMYNLDLLILHCGIRIGAAMLGGVYHNIKMQYCKFANICYPFGQSTTDNQWLNIYLNGVYAADLVPVTARTNTHDNKVFRQVAYNFYNPGPLDRINNFIFEYASIACVYIDRTLLNFFGTGLFDGVTRYGFLARTAYVGPSGPYSSIVQFNQIAIRTEFSFDNHNTLHDTAAFRIMGETPTNTARPVKIAIGMISITDGGGGDLDGAFNISSATTLVDHNIRVGQLGETNGVAAINYPGGQLAEILDERWTTSPSEMGIGPYFPTRNSKANWSVAIADTQGLALTTAGLEVKSTNNVFPLRLNRVDVSKVWAFNISTDLIRFYNETAGFYGFQINTDSTQSSVTLGLAGVSTHNPRPSSIQAELAGNTVATTCTISSANPGVVTLASHGFTAGVQVMFATSGALPTNIVAGIAYYVISSGLTSSEFQISATSGGAAIDTTAGVQSGAHTVQRVNMAASTMNIITSRGTGNDQSGGGLALYTPDQGSSGATAQSVTMRFKFKRQGELWLLPRSSDPTLEIADGNIYINSLSKKLRTYLNSKWGNIDRWTIREDTSTTVTIGAADEIVTVSNASPVAISLPAGILNQRYYIKNIGSGLATITPNGAETLFSDSSLSTLDLSTGQYVLLQWDGTYWQVISSNIDVWYQDEIVAEGVTGTSVSLLNTPKKVLFLYKNGQYLVSGKDYTRSGTSITLTDSLVVRDILTANYL